mmetsp:Transcript_59334/g.133667  ORF Transcript_59334/g.133667 Transcript_59334/m.133667 type:complete len:272 (-) Transcript_59334:90-905(-)
MSKLQWNVLSTFGLRNLGWAATSISRTYRDTVCYYSVRYYPAVKGHVALTIDDGLCRQGADKSLAEDVRRLLQEHGATATFFICSDYLVGLGDAARAFLEDGHELGNHCPKDREYASLKPADFEAALLSTSQAIEGVPCSGGAQGKAPSWFRAPQANLTASMLEAVKRHGMRHALGDCYCDDWAIEDPEYISRTLLGQADHGSIIVLHMPELGFREHCFRALQLLLEGLSQRGLRCVTLSALDELAHPRDGDVAGSGMEEAVPEVPVANAS